MSNYRAFDIAGSVALPSGSYLGTWYKNNLQVTREDGRPWDVYIEPSMPMALIAHLVITTDHNAIAVVESVLLQDILKSIEHEKARQQTRTHTADRD